MFNLTLPVVAGISVDRCVWKALYVRLEFVMGKAIMIVVAMFPTDYTMVAKDD